MQDLRLKTDPKIEDQARDDANSLYSVLGNAVYMLDPIQSVPGAETELLREARRLILDARFKVAEFIGRRQSR